MNIGPYQIKGDGTVRTVHPKVMPGRLTGTARHLTDPKNKIMISTMEEGLYSLDVNTLEVTEHIKDGNRQKAVGNGVNSKLPGYHGKGLYSGQGRAVHSNNGEKGRMALTKPDVPSGALGQWFGEGDWQLVRRNQFTEVTGPGGVYGNTNPKTDPIWAMGWDYRSVILMLLDNGKCIRTACQREVIHTMEHTGGTLNGRVSAILKRTHYWLRCTEHFGTSLKHLT